MTDEQTTRIILGAIIIAAIPFVKTMICQHLGDDYEGERSWRYALGKMAGRAVGDLRRILLKIAK